MSKLREYRKDLGLTLAQLAQLAAPCSVSYLSQIENGLRRPAPDVARRLERATGGVVTALDLLYPAKAEPAVVASEN